MISAVDSSVLIDIFSDDTRFRERSLIAVRRCLAEGRLIACDIVWAEATAGFSDPTAGRQALAAIPVAFAPLDAEAAETAGRAWRDYKARGGSRDRIVSDFLIGAHAVHHADRLLTRDRGFHRRAFADLEILDPMV